MLFQVCALFSMCPYCHVLILACAHYGMYCMLQYVLLLACALLVVCHNKVIIKRKKKKIAIIFWPWIFFCRNFKNSCTKWRKWFNSRKYPTQTWADDSEILDDGSNFTMHIMSKKCSMQYSHYKFWHKRGSCVLPGVKLRHSACMILLISLSNFIRVEMFDNF